MSNIITDIKLSGVTYQIQDSTAIHSMDGYWTSAQTESAITAATGALAETIGEELNGKADSSAVTQEISAAVSGKADSSAVTAVNDTLTAHTANTDIHVTAEDKTKWNSVSAISGYADSVQYNSTSKYMEFYHGGTSGTKVYEFDASPFLIDGMVQNVEIKTVTSADYVVNYSKDGESGGFVASTFAKSATLASLSGASSSNKRTLIKTKFIDSNGVETEEFTSTASGSSTSTDISGVPTTYCTMTKSGRVIEITPVSGYRMSKVWCGVIDNYDAPVNTDCYIHVAAQIPALVISFNTDAGKQDITIPLSEIFDPTNYYTKSETDSKISQAVSGKADSSAVTADIAAAVSGKADASDVETLSGTVTGMNATLTAHTADTTIHVTSSDKSTWSGKQDALVNQVNIKSINGTSLLGSGDISVQNLPTVSVTTLIFS